MRWQECTELKRLSQRGIDEAQIRKIIGNGYLIDIIARMEAFLDPDSLYQILDSCACIGDKGLLRRSEQYGRETAGQPLQEKIRGFRMLHSDFEHITLRDDNTISAAMHISDDQETYRCVCPAALRPGQKVADLVSGNRDSDNRAMPLSYCFCCAGYFRWHLQNGLAVRLKGILPDQQQRKAAL